MNPNPKLPDTEDTRYQSAVTAAVRANIPYNLSRPTATVLFPPCGRTSRPACRFDTDRVKTDETNAPTARAENVNFLL